jgi:hypothetical protein
VGFVVVKAALGQVYSENFGFPCQSFHRFLHHHNHPGLAWPQCRVDLGFHPPLYKLKKINSYVTASTYNEPPAESNPNSVSSNQSKNVHNCTE